MAESGPHNLPDDALVDLLVKQVTEGLSAAEQRELDVLDSAVASALRKDFERAAAALTLAGTRVEQPPADLVKRLQIDAEKHFATVGGKITAGMLGAAAVSGLTGASDVADAAGATGSYAAVDALAADNVVPFQTPNRNAASRPQARSAAWGWIAAAACLILALFGWLRHPEIKTPGTPDVNVVSLPPPVAPPVALPPPPAAPTPTEQRLALLDNPDAVKVTLGATKDPAAAGVTGDAVWDPQTQTGFLHFVGLASNDPSVRQYQIWIFDGSRDKKFPVDGGVFDVPADSNEVVIPIRASLHISAAKAFAVTVESPGGVVVSKLGHVVVLGSTG
jgi:hypothetical protein